MDIIEANECLRHWYGPPRKGTFDSKDVGVLEGEPQPLSQSPAERAAAAAAVSTTSAKIGISQLFTPSSRIP